MWLHQTYSLTTKDKAQSTRLLAPRWRWRRWRRFVVLIVLLHWYYRLDCAGTYCWGWCDCPRQARWRGPSCSCPVRPPAGAWWSLQHPAWYQIRVWNIIIGQFVTNILMKDQIGLTPHHGPRHTCVSAQSGPRARSSRGQSRGRCRERSPWWRSLCGWWWWGSHQHCHCRQPLVLKYCYCYCRPDEVRAELYWIMG